MKWSWKGPLALVGVAVLAYFVFVFVAAIVGIVAGYLAWWEGLLMMLSVVIVIALFVGSGFVAAKIIQRRKARQPVEQRGGCDEG